MKIIKHIISAISAILFLSCAPKITKNPDTVTENIASNPSGQGSVLQIRFVKGVEFNHPSFVIWAEDTAGIFIQTLFITKSVATGIYEHGSSASGKWEPSLKNYPAVLPYWSHKRNIKQDKDLLSNPVPDSYTGATPQHHFIVSTRLDKENSGKICILMEINQTWDWNEFWTNNKFPDDADYKTSCQPALVYKALIDLTQPQADIELKAIGHSHYSGKDGSLTTDLGSITTALKIVEKISVMAVK